MVTRLIPIDTADKNVFQNPAVRLASVIDDGAATVKAVGVDPADPRLPDQVNKANRGYADVTDYGAVGDGTTDDRAAIQAAIDAVSAAGGGRVWFPKGDYRLTATTTSDTVVHHLSVIADNVELDFANGARLLTSVSNAAAIFAIGAAKVSGINSWSSNMPTDATVYTITGPVAAGALTVTTATASDAGNLAPGDDILVRTGQTIAGTEQPDGEINKVVSADPGTGVITLAWPTVKPYAQEYYVTGTDGVTTTSVTANAAPFGVAKITDRVLRNFVVKNMTVDSSGGRHVIVGGSAVGVRIENCSADVTGAGLASFGAARFAWYRKNRLRVRGTGAATYALGPDSMSSDAWIEDNDFAAERSLYVHLHEGAANATVQRNRIASRSMLSGEVCVSVRSRGYNHVIRDNYIAASGAAGSVGIYVDSLCDGGGVIRDNTILATSGAVPMSVVGDGWHVGPNRFTDNAAVTLLGRKLVVQPETISGVVRWDEQSVTIGTLPIRAFILGVYLFVNEAFNSDGTDMVKLGFSGTLNGYFADTDVSTVGRKAPTIGAFSYQSATREVIGTYTAGGSAPTTGKATVVVEYVLVPQIT